MKAYIGAKIIQAEPQVKDGIDGYKVLYPDGYVSWSPKAVFEGAYRLIHPAEAGLIAEQAEETPPPLGIHVSEDLKMTEKAGN